MASFRTTRVYFLVFGWSCGMWNGMEVKMADLTGIGEGREMTA